MDRWSCRGCRFDRLPRQAGGHRRTDQVHRTSLVTEITTTTPRPLFSPMKPPKLSETAITHVRSTNRPGQSNPAREPGSACPGKRILLVDDDPTVRDSLNDVLLAEGYFII